MSASSDKVDAPSERDDKEGDADREKQAAQEMSTHSSSVPPSSVEADGQTDPKGDVVDPLEKDIEKVRFFVASRILSCELLCLSY